MPNHKALFLQSKCGAWEVAEQETRKPGPGELLVRIEACGLNPIEWKIHTYGSAGPVPKSYPTVLGSDIAGVVEEVGEGVSGFAKGDRVVYQGAFENDKAGYQHYGIANVDFVAKIPSNLSFDEAATLPVAIATVATGFYGSKPHGAGLTLPVDEAGKGKYSGKPLLIIGGASSLGQSAIQFACLSGFFPILTTASPSNAGLLKSLGATHVFDRNLSTADLAAQVAEAIGDAPLELVFDTISAPPTQQAGYDLLSEGGHLIIVVPEMLKPVEGRNVTYSMVHGIWGTPFNVEIGRELHKHMTALLADGSIKPNRVEVLPGGLRGVFGGLERLKAGSVSGTKLIAHPHETD